LETISNLAKHVIIDFVDEEGITDSQI